MNEHLTTENIELYQRREIDGSSLRELDTHLANCEACLESVLNSEYSVLSFSSLNEALLPNRDEAPFHLSKVELQNYREGSVDEADSIIYNSHLEDCETCQVKLHALSETAVVESQQTEPVHEEQKQPLGIRKRRAWLTPARAVLAILVLALITFGLSQLRRQNSSTELVPSGSQANQVDSEPRVPEVASEVAPASEVTPEAAESVSRPLPLVVLNDNNREIKLEANGKLTGLEGLDESTQRTVKAALKGEELPKPGVLAELSLPKAKSSGKAVPDPFQLSSPLGKVVSEARPTLRWRALPKANTYVVSIFDEKLNRVARSPAIKTLQWTSNVSLKRGHSYSWDVRATRDGKEVASPARRASAKFRILEAEHQNSLAKLKRQTPVSHLVLGLAYVRAGLVSDAEQEFRQLVKGNPDSSVAKKLLRTVQGWN